MSFQKIFYYSHLVLSASCMLPLYAIKHPTGFISLAQCIKEHLPVQFLLQEHGQQQFVVSLPHGAAINDGGIVTADGFIFGDTETYHKDQQQLLRGDRNIAEEQALYFDGRLAVISSPGQENWYHWLFQVLPRLKVLADSGILYDKIYVANVMYPWQKQSLALALKALGIPEERLMLTQGDTIIEAKTLIVPSVPFIQSQGIHLPAWLKQFIRSIFLVSTEATNAPRIYISRSKAKVRKISNEDALKAYLKEQGFVILHLEDLSIYDQARYIHNAEIIVGPHGSGFSNLVFARPHTRIIEIDHGLAGHEQRSCFKAIARMMACKYYPFFVDTVDEARLEDDLVVDIESFDTFFKQCTFQHNNNLGDYKHMKLTPKSFYFIRHGQTDWNKIHRLQGQIDIPLNEEGRSQAQELQTLLHNLEIAYVFHSPLSRAKETMHIACKHLEVPKVELDTLKERHFGEWEGTEWDEVKRDTHMHFVPKNGESYAAFHERVLMTVNKMLEESAGKVLFVAHAGTFRALCRALDTHFEAAVHNCQLFYFVAPDETDDQWRIYEL